MKSNSVFNAHNCYKNVHRKPTFLMTLICCICFNMDTQLIIRVGLTNTITFDIEYISSCFNFADHKALWVGSVSRLVG